MQNHSLRLTLMSLALLPAWIGGLSLALQRSDATILLALAALSGLAAISTIWLARRAPRSDPHLLPTAVMLTSFGLLSIARTAPNFLDRQVLALGIGFALMLIITARGDCMRWLWRFKYAWLLAGLFLLFASLVFGVNPSGAGPRLWLNIGGLFFQPSELVRLLTIAFLAAYFAEQPTGEWHTLAPTALMVALAVAMLLTQQDLGATSLLLITYGLTVYLAVGRRWLLIGLASALLVATALGYVLSARVAQRINIWLNPWADPQGSAFQIVQSLIAVANGGLFGQGINQGRPDYVPAVHTDFPFVMIAEELGLAGALAVLAGYAVLILRAWQIGLRAPNRYGLLLAGGLAVGLGIQVFIVIGGNLRLSPITGATLPFISYGGTSLVVSYTMLSLLLRLSADALPTAAERPGQRRARLMMRAGAALIAALGLAAGYWGVVRAGGLLARLDNPRLVEAERATLRGPIYTRDGKLLVYSSCADGLWTCAGARPIYQRRYPHPEAAPATGYYSLRYGTGGLEAFADATLRGPRTWWDDLLHRPRIGAGITSSLDLIWQARAVQALRAGAAHTTAQGAAVVLDWRSGEVLALASAPSFDPNRLEQDWDTLRADPGAPLVNRATQGLYQPGPLLAWLFSLREADPADFRRWQATAQALGLSAHVPFELPNEAVPVPVTTTYSETLGQGHLRVTPLRVAVSVAEVIAGQPVTPTLIARGAAPVNRPPAIQPLPFTGQAQIANDRFVGWHVRADEQRVIVLALELPLADHHALHRAISTIGDHRP
jgi:peptidoglycan glycosyltransferase